jgi:hypothetical protein
VGDKVLECGACGTEADLNKINGINVNYQCCGLQDGPCSSIAIDSISNSNSNTPSSSALPQSDTSSSMGPTMRMLYETVGMSTLPIPSSPPGEESATVVTGGDDHVHNGDHEHDNAGGFMYTGDVAEFFNGHIASYNVYKEALTAEQVHALYRDTLTGNPCALSVAHQTELFGAQGQGQGSDSVNTVKVNMNPDAPDPT